MKRREFITLLGGATFAGPLAARAQQATKPVIGFLSAVSPEGSPQFTRAFQQGLKEVGFVEGENVEVDYRWAKNKLDLLPGMANDLVRKQVAIITAQGGTAPAIAAKAATNTIPIVFTVPEDPVALGLVASLSRPGGNLTGVNLFIGELMLKRLGLLRDLLPGMARFAVFINPANLARAISQANEAESASTALGLRVQIFKVGSIQEINAAFEVLARVRPDALFVGPDPYLGTRRVHLATMAARHAIPTSFSVRDFTEAGGLMSYGTDIADSYRQAGIYTGRILRGAKPSDLPVVQASKFELVINIQTARMLGITVSPTLLATADEVIE
jgi:ABC-type uncharacterized transport system substrate-binding protein